MIADFGVAKGYICPVRLIYVVQPLSFDHPLAVKPEDLEEEYEKKRRKRMAKVMAK